MGGWTAIWLLLEGNNFNAEGNSTDWNNAAELVARLQVPSAERVVARNMYWRARFGLFRNRPRRIGWSRFTWGDKDISPQPGHRTARFPAADDGQRRTAQCGC